MKKTIGILIAVLAILVFCIPAYASVTNPYDLNNDGVVNSADVTYWQSHPLDLNGDGICDIGDVIAIGSHYTPVTTPTPTTQPLSITINRAILYLDGYLDDYDYDYFIVENKNTVACTYEIKVIPYSSQSGTWAATPPDVMGDLWVTKSKVTLQPKQKVTIYTGADFYYGMAYPVKWCYAVNVKLVTNSSAQYIVVDSNVAVPVCITMH